MDKKSNLVVPKEEASAIPGRNEYSEEAKKCRLDFISRMSGHKLDLRVIPAANLSAEAMKGHIENFIGAVSIPLGLVGPLRFQGSHANGVIYAPFATTEGALVASASRGSQLLTQAGGVTTQVISHTIYRAPCFECADLGESMQLKKFIEDQLPILETLVSEVSRYARLQEAIPVPNGRTLHCLFHFESGDAAGQNMATIAAEHLARWLVREAETKIGLRIRSFYVEGGMNGDKKVNFYNFIKGRGVRVAAECFIPDSIFAERFQLSAQEFYVHYTRGVGASSLVGSIGTNVNIANVIAAIFVATGQDIASVHESSLGHLQVDRDRDGLYCCLTLPSLLVGTVGGGTTLPAQKEALSMIGCDGSGGKLRLAEIIAGFCLALDLSTWAAIANSSFTSAHRRLGRP